MTFRLVATIGSVALLAGCHSSLDLRAPATPTPTPASTWWNCDWSRRMPLQAGVPDGAAVTNFPIAVRLDPSRIDYSAVQASGSDLRFVLGTGSGAVVLDHEIESFTPGGESVAWVRVPSLPLTAPLRLYYGNPAAPDAQSASSVWDDAFAGVWHMTSDGGVRDSTAHGNDGVLVGTTAAQGAMGPALHFDGASAVRVSNPDFHDTLSSFTVSLWVRIDDTVSEHALVFDLNGTNLYPRIRVPPGGRVLMQLAIEGALTAESYDTVDALEAGVGAHYATTFDGATGTSSMFLNAVLDSTHTFSGATLGGGTTNLFRLGEDLNLNDHLVGLLDEVRVSNVVRSDDWIATEHRAITDSLVTYGASEVSDCP